MLQFIQKDYKKLILTNIFSYSILINVLEINEVHVNNICEYARVAQWWSIALPRRGSRVRIPSRALDKIICLKIILWVLYYYILCVCSSVG